MGSLKTFIKSVRKSKTIAAERAAIRKESAKIRSSFRDPHVDNEKRRKNLQKLIYLYILGEPTYFGQVECLKLLASNKFTDKRIGYLATMLILDENQDILTLLTNCLDLDMNSNDVFTQGFALVTLGNIASSELAKDLHPQVEKLLSSSYAYIRKKSALVAAKLVEKEPYLSEIFVVHISKLLDEKHHGVLLGTLYLIEAIYNYDKGCHESIFKSVPKILTHLNILSISGYSAEYDIKNIPDPFLYVSLLRTLRVVLKNEKNGDQLERLNDLLTQVCATLENSKGPGYAVLYEAVKTIFAINSDSSLKVLGINILSKFLSQKDNNIRYVALDTLLSVIEFEPLAVQRHRSLIVKCLNDDDISIRRRSLELTFGIINSKNIKILTKELILFLNNDDDDLKGYITTQLTICINKFSSDIEWNLINFVELLKFGGNYCEESIISIILSKIMQNSDINLTRKIISDLVTQSRIYYKEYGLAIVTIWCIGEFGDVVIGNAGIDEQYLSELMDYILLIPSFNNEQQTQLKMYALTAALKLSVKFKNMPLIEKLRNFISHFKGDVNLEVQLRAVEYSQICCESDSIKRGLLERMPAPPVKKHEGVALLDRSQHFNSTAVENIGSGGVIEGDDASTATGSVQAQNKKSGDLLLDLLGDDFGLGSSKPAVKGQDSANNVDILSDIFGSASIGNSQAKSLLKNSQQYQQPQQNQSATVKPPNSVEAFKDDKISVGFIEKPITEKGIAELEIIVENLTSDDITDISLLCAVPKHQKLQLSALQSSSLKGGKFTQLHAKISGKEGSKLKIRVKLGYSSVSHIEKQFDYTGRATL
ncbi:Apl4 protein [Martiniozyma asiatica (nom. inval.)]|nr:Apl4 protein [Martiniozyma asiatica]